MKVIGTAGHVDHGKSSLIAALTGRHPDRLKEEQAREMTIELGFGWMALPNGEEVGIVDVPGHRDFIENMLAGVGGIDAALLVIAADEGIMPQTREHLQILDLLEIPVGLIVITKIDLAPDPDWLDLLEADVRSVAASTVLQDAPIVRVSAKTRAGLDSLVKNIQDILEKKPERRDLDRPRLPIDRVFKMSGFGTVVTGTLSDGHLSIGDEVEVLPSAQKGRVRGLQTHNKKEDRAEPGSRTAVNISGVDTDSIRRGEVLIHPGDYQTTRRVDANLHVLKDASIAIRHGIEVKFFVGASETVATLRLLGTDELKQGETGWVQLELQESIVTVRGDRYILRRPSPGETLGGGRIMDHRPRGRHRRFDADVIRSLSSLARGSPSDLLLESAAALGIASLKDVVSKSRLESTVAQSAIDELLRDGRMLPLEQSGSANLMDTLVTTQEHWSEIRSRAVEILNSYHKQFPYRKGIPREEFKSKLNTPPRIFNAMVSKLTGDHRIIELGGAIAAEEHKVQYAASDRSKINDLLKKFASNPFATPSIKDCQNDVGEEVFNALIESGDLVTVSQDVVFLKKDYDDLIARIKTAILHNGPITLAQVRDMLNTTRKYVQALLEHMDAIGITQRDGDFRILKKGTR